MRSTAVYYTRLEESLTILTPQIMYTGAATAGSRAVVPMVPNPIAHVWTVDAPERSSPGWARAAARAARAREPAAQEGIA